MSAIALATRAPVMVVPAAHEGPADPSLGRELEQLAADGLHVVPAGDAREIAQRVDSLLHARPGGAPVRTADDWNQIYRRDVGELPWHREAADDDLLAAIDRAAPTPAAVLDIGTGLGTLAIACAQRGHRVVATDLSDVALAQARARAGDLPIVWLQDDAADSRLHGTFDLAIDRGCLHLLVADEPAGYAAALARTVRPGGVALIKTLAPEAAAARRATAYDAARIAALLGEAFALEADQPSTLAGPADAPQARLFVLRRRDRAP